MRDETTIKSVKHALRIEDVIGESISLKKKGSGYVGVCSFHQDTRPSLRISQSKKSFPCLLCQEGGDDKDVVQNLAYLPFA